MNSPILLFQKQAAAFGFDEKRYLDLLNKVPVVSEEKVKTAMDFLLNMTEFISELALQKVKQEKITQNLKDSEQKFKAIFEAANAGKSIILPSGEINVNEAYCKILGYNRQELENKNGTTLHPKKISRPFKSYLIVWRWVKKIQSGSKKIHL